MTANRTHVLFSRRDCHLCELAAALLDRMDVEWCEVDIDQDESLVRAYGLSVPVLQHAESKEELCYPFGEQDVRRFLESGR
jgi:glutaredoxin